MREEERFEEENISRESCQEPRVPYQDPFQDPSQDSQGSLEPGTELPGIPKTIEAHFSIVGGGVAKLINQRLALGNH